MMTVMTIELNNGVNSELSRLLEQVQANDEMILTQNGTPVARLLPITQV